MKVITLSSGSIVRVGPGDGRRAVYLDIVSDEKMLRVSMSSEETEKVIARLVASLGSVHADESDRRIRGLASTE